MAPEASCVSEAAVKGDVIGWSSSGSGSARDRERNGIEREPEDEAPEFTPPVERSQNSQPLDLRRWLVYYSRLASAWLRLPPDWWDGDGRCSLPVRDLQQPEEAVPRIKSAKKRMRQTAAATARNRTQRSQLRSAIKKVRT
ncbi:MAG: 30S ribosomal protein S20, partial [Gemmatimonadota bacterium]